jgi:phage tail-like protein
VPARADPYGNFNFLVEIDGIASQGFSELILPEASAAVIEYREGEEPNTVRKLPGLIRFDNVILRRAITASNELYAWWRTVQDGQTSRRSMVVTLLDEGHNAVKRWRFRNAWPVRYESSALDAQGSAVVIETLEVAHEGMEVE